MKRSSMKSNISLQPRCRPEGRLFPRRKVAVKPHLFNGVGDFDMELSLAIQESLKYAQEKEDELRENGLCDSSGTRCAESDSKRDALSVSYNRDEQPRVPNKSMNHDLPTASSDWAREEVGRLKDLLTSQAELIQCQQDEIAEKDRELKALRSAKDALQCRLERMERRLSILKQKEESHDGHGTTATEAAARTSVSSHFTPHKGPNEISSIEFKKKRRRGHKLNFSQRKRHKRQRLVKPAVDRNRTVGEEEEDESDEEDEESSDGSGDEEESQSDSGDSENYREGSDNENQDDSISEQEEKVIDYPIMQTETLYHLYYPKHHCISPDAKKIQEQCEVETPSWRLKPMTNMYQLEGTENITDEAYFKRHQKFELEEKRRKRWDLQRLRELRMFEKLQRQREDEIRASQDEADVETFLPSIHDLKHIEITDSVPVMAFGQPVPYVSPAEFEIPWEITNSGAMTTTGRQRTASVQSRRH